MGIGDWGLGIGDWAQSPIPNPQSPIPNFFYEINISLYKSYIIFLCIFCFLVLFYCSTYYTSTFITISIKSS